MNKKDFRVVDMALGKALQNQLQSKIEQFELCKDVKEANYCPIILSFKCYVLYTNYYR